MANPESRRAVDTGVGKAGVGAPGVVILTALFAAVSVLLLYSLITFWPPSLADNVTAAELKQPTEFVFFGATLQLDREHSLLLIVALSGAIGGMAYVLRSFFKYVGERHLVWSWVPSYVLTPIVGAVMATLTYVVVRAGLISGAGGSIGNPFGFAALGLLVGLFSAQAAEKLKQVFETLFAQVPPGSESIGSANQPVIATFDPAEGMPGDEVSVRGTGIEAAGAVAFGGGTSSSATWDADAGALNTTVPIAAETGPISVTIGATTATSTTPFVVLGDVEESPAVADEVPAVEVFAGDSPEGEPQVVLGDSLEGVG